MALCSKSWTDINIDLSTKTIRHCCKAQGEQYKTLSESFINSSPGVIQRREQSKQGIKHSQCNHCWKHEAKSSLSYRDIHNDPTLDYSKTDEELISFIEIKFDNVCNLGCVYCYEIESSTIAKEKNIEPPFTKFDPNDVDIVVDYILSSSHTFECPPSLANVLLLPFRVLFYLGMSKSVPGILDQGSALLIGLSELAGVSG